MELSNKAKEIMFCLLRLDSTADRMTLIEEGLELLLAQEVQRAEMARDESREEAA